MEIYSHDLTFSQEAPPDYSLYLNFLDYTFDVKISQACIGSDDYSARYYFGEELAGILRFRYSIIQGVNKPIAQKVCQLVDAACDKLIGHVIIDLKVKEDQLLEMSNAITLHATRKVKEFVSNHHSQGEVPQ